MINMFSKRNNQFFSAFATLLIVFVITSMSIFAAEKEVCFKTNMHCESCQSKITKTLQKTSGIVKQDVNLAKNTVTLKYNSDQTDETKLAKSITDLGFKADVLASASTSQTTNSTTKAKTAPARKK